MTGSPESSAPLAGVRIADLSRVLAGPYCTMVLADLGADVIKVERPEGGDETRSWGPPFVGGEAAYYLSVNRGKRSCALDLSQPEGRELALELCAGAHAVIENFKVGGAERLGVGYDQVRAANPSVVYCSITGFGSRREPQGRPGYDFVAQAETGLMSITGPRRALPTRWAWRWSTCSPGCTRPPPCWPRCTGARAPGSRCRCSTAAWPALVNVAQNALVTGTDPERYGNAHPNIVPYQDFETASGRIAVAAANDGLFRRLCDVIGRPELAADRALCHERGPGRAAAGAHPAAGRSGCASARPTSGSRRCRPPAFRWARCGRCRRRSTPRPPPGAPRRCRSSTPPPARSTWSPRRCGSMPSPPAVPALRPRRCSASTPQRCCASSGERRRRSRISWPAGWSLSAARRHSRPEGATPRPAT